MSEQPSSPRRINIYEASDLLYWASKFGVSPEQLKHVVQKVGESPVDVAPELQGGDQLPDDDLEKISGGMKPDRYL